MSYKILRSLPLSWSLTSLDSLDFRMTALLLVGLNPSRAPGGQIRGPCGLEVDLEDKLVQLDLECACPAVPQMTLIDLDSRLRPEG